MSIPCEEDDINPVEKNHLDIDVLSGHNGFKTQVESSPDPESFLLPIPIEKTLNTLLSPYFPMRRSFGRLLGIFYAAFRRLKPHFYGRSKHSKIEYTFLSD